MEHFQVQPGITSDPKGTSTLQTAVLCSLPERALNKVEQASEVVWQ